MVKGEERAIVDKRLEETLDLFRPTARQEAAAAEMEEKARSGKTRMSRRWDREHPAFPLRIGPENNERIVALAGQLGATKDEVTRGLIGAALEAIEDGRLWLIFDRKVTIKEIPAKTPRGQAMTRRVPITDTDVRWTWGDRGKSRGQM